jgi:predicted RNA-binding protein with RPS1 domain
MNGLINVSNINIDYVKNIKNIKNTKNVFFDFLLIKIEKCNLN